MVKPYNKGDIAESINIQYYLRPTHYESIAKSSVAIGKQEIIYKWILIGLKPFFSSMQMVSTVWTTTQEDTKLISCQG